MRPRLLHVDTRYAVTERDADTVVQNIETILGLAHQTTETPFLVSTLVAVATTRIGFNQLEEVITENPEFFSKAQLTDLQNKIKQTDIRSWLNYEGERLFLKDIVQRCYTDDGDGDGYMTAAGMKFLKSGYLLETGTEDPFDDNELVKIAASAVAPRSAVHLCNSPRGNDKSGRTISTTRSRSETSFLAV